MATRPCQQHSRDHGPAPAVLLLASRMWMLQYCHTSGQLLEWSSHFEGAQLVEVVKTGGVEKGPRANFQGRWLELGRMEAAFSSTLDHANHRAFQRQMLTAVAE
jgi:hypothetical protein